MSRMMLSRLVGVALVDKDFCEGLMNGKRSALLAEFDLTDEEREMVDSFDPQSVRELASNVHNWLIDEDTPLSSPIDGNSVQIL